MTSIEEHKKSFTTMIRDIEEKVRSKNEYERQKLIAFAASEASCDLLAIFLHNKNLTDPGFNVNHRFFASKKIAESRLEFNFPSKEIIVKLMVEQERYRNLLCYGKLKEEKHVLKCIENLFTIKKIVEKECGEIL